MGLRIIVAGIAAAVVTGLPADDARSPQTGRGVEPGELTVPVGSTSLHARVVGQGRPMIVLHDYDQRGRGKSAEGVRPEDVTLASDVDDLDKVRRHFDLEAPALLGHSWGAVLALEYALRHPSRVSHLVLMNPAPVSTSDLALLRKSYLAQLGADMDRQRAIVAGAAYQSGDPEAVAARYRIHFTHALKRPADYERLMTAMKAAFMRQGAAGIVKARAVEDQLMRDTWERPDYDLLPKLRSLRIPALVIAGDHDFIPVEVATHVANALPNATNVTIKDCGHFAYLECPGDTRRAIDQFFSRGR